MSLLIPVISPAAGRIVALEEVPDPAFAGGFLGPGFAVEPSSGTFVAPAAGELALVAGTGHAYAIRTPEGAEILVHIGLDTVALGGEGFTALHAVGDRVPAGEPIMQVDLATVAGKAPSTITPVIITNADTFAVAELNLAAPAGEPVALLKPA